MMLRFPPASRGWAGRGLGWAVVAGLSTSRNLRLTRRYTISATLRFFFGGLFVVGGFILLLTCLDGGLLEIRDERRGLAVSDIFVVRKTVASATVMVM